MTSISVLVLMSVSNYSEEKTEFPNDLISLILDWVFSLFLGYSVLFIS
jgi:hypothetical protein